MKKYWILFIVIVSIGVTGFGTIIFKCFIQKPQLKLYYLNIDSLREASDGVTDSTNRLSIVGIFPSQTRNIGNEAIPWADVYVCKSFNKKDSLSGDTAIILIDVTTKGYSKNTENVDHYRPDIIAEKKHNKCKVLIPANQIDSLKKFRYKFGNVKLIDDWLYD